VGCKRLDTYFFNFLEVVGSEKRGAQKKNRVSVFDYVYQYKDHLGNVRLSYQDINNNGSVTSSEIKEENNYYPFGLEHKGYGPASTSNHPYKFGGKEFNQELGLDWYDYGARNYDPAVGRWFNVDPLAELMDSESTYSYALNNPIYYRDTAGQSPKGMMDPYLVFNGKDGKLYIYDDNDTPDDKSDDVLVGTFDAHNNVSTRSQGKWEDGTYSMVDKNTRRTRTSMETVNLPLRFYILTLSKADQGFRSHRWSRGVKKVRTSVRQDSDYGRYGQGGIYRASSFTQSNSKYRSGMAVHSGRLYKPFASRITMGCIRTTNDAMSAIDAAIKEYGSLTSITVEDNLSPVQPKKANVQPMTIIPVDNPQPNMGPVNLLPLPAFIPPPQEPMPIIPPPDRIDN
jgi:RHS repeat-associated protein